MYNVNLWIWMDIFVQEEDEQNVCIKIRYLGYSCEFDEDRVIGLINNKKQNAVSVNRMI